MAKLHGGANEIQQANMITLENDYVISPQFFFHVNEFWNNLFCNLL